MDVDTYLKHERLAFLSRNQDLLTMKDTQLLSISVQTGSMNGGRVELMSTMITDLSTLVPRIHGHHFIRMFLDHLVGVLILLGKRNGFSLFLEKKINSEINLGT